MAFTPIRTTVTVNGQHNFLMCIGYNEHVTNGETWTATEYAVEPVRDSGSSAVISRKPRSWRGCSFKPRIPATT